MQAECTARPLLILIEDLHWGDLPTVTLLDASLRLCASLPLLVVALARPEVRATFPQLWEHRQMEQLRLGGLPARAGERLVRAVLGEDAGAATVARIVQQAAGNAFYLEELIRAVAEGHGEALPETVLGMTEARLAAFEPDARRVLRAASVFGPVFWAGGVAALLGVTLSREDLDVWLDTLEQREVVARQPESRFAGERELAFRHAMVREAAYGMLTDRDRALGHRLAGGWLEIAGETDAAVLAEHQERGGERARAADAYARAADQALEGDDFAGALALAERGVACGAAGEALGRLRACQALACHWRGEIADMGRHASEAAALLPPTEERRWIATAAAARAAQLLGRRDELLVIAADLAASLAVAPHPPGLVTAAARTAGGLIRLGLHAEAAALLATAEGALASGGDDPVAEAWVRRARAQQALYAGDSGGCLTLATEALHAFRRAGDLRQACSQAMDVAFSLIEHGRYAEAETSLREGLLTAERMGLALPINTAKNNLGLALGCLGRIEEAARVERESVAGAHEAGDVRAEGSSRVYLSRILAKGGDAAGAEQEARAAADLLVAVPPMRPYAFAALAEALALQAREEEALAAAREAMDQLHALGGVVEEGEALVRLTFAEALRTAGDEVGARDAITRARDRLLERAGPIGDPMLRQSFLEGVSEHARTLARAREWAIT